MKRTASEQRRRDNAARMLRADRRIKRRLKEMGEGTVQSQFQTGAMVMVKRVKRDGTAEDQ